MGTETIEEQTQQTPGSGGQPVALDDKKPTLKKIYESTKEPKKTGATVTASEQPEAISTQPDVQKTGPSTIQKASKGKDLSLAAGGVYPEGVPPGMTKLAWDYDKTTGKYMVGKTKELRRMDIWDRYRKINKASGNKMSSFGKLVNSLPTVASLKHDTSGS
jgi:hypothetical protein